MCGVIKIKKDISPTSLQLVDYSVFLSHLLKYASKLESKFGLETL